jgi:hypothetical protein
MAADRKVVDSMSMSRTDFSIPGGPVRWGAWLLPIAGIIPAIFFTIGMMTSNPDPDTDPKGAAEAATNAGAVVVGIILIVATLALIFGLFALYAWLASGRTRNSALAGLLLSVVSVGLLLAGLGAAILAAAIAADVYLSGDAGASAVLTKLSGGTFGRAVVADFIVAIVVALAGSVANGVAIWRSGTLPRWSGVLYAAGFTLVIASTPIVTQVGGILLLIGGIWIARTISGQSATATTRPATVSPA